MATNTSIPKDIMVKLLKGYMLNSKLSRECIEFLSKTIIETHTEEENGDRIFKEGIIS